MAGSHTFNPSTQRQGLVVLCEFKAHLVNIMSSSLVHETLSQKNQKIKVFHIKRGVNLFLEISGFGAFV